MRQIKKLTWLQAYDLGDVGVIWCNSFGNSLFQILVMNFVDFVFNCYTHITSHVSQAFASCTHYTSYSLLNIVHVIICVFGLTNQVCKYFEFYAKLIWWLKIYGDCKKFKLWKIGLNSLFLKIISSHTHAFCSSISMFWVVPKIFFKNCVFTQNFVSLCQFRLIQSVFRSIEIVLNCLRKPLSVSIDPICFSINRKCLWNCFKIFEKSLPVSINRNSWIRF